MEKKRKKLPGWMFHVPEWKEYEPGQTGLPVPVWIDVCGRKHKRSPRYMRFVTWDDGYFRHSFPMVISRNPYVPGWSSEDEGLNEDVFLKVREFVIKNREILADVGLGTLGTQGFERKLAESVSIE